MCLWHTSGGGNAWQGKGTHLGGVCTCLCGLPPESAGQCRPFCHAASGEADERELGVPLLPSTVAAVQSFFGLVMFCAVRYVARFDQLGCMHIHTYVYRAHMFVV